MINLIVVIFNKITYNIEYEFVNLSDFSRDQKELAKRVILEIHQHLMQPMMVDFGCFTKNFF